MRLRYANAGAFGQMQYAVTPAVRLTLGGRAEYNTRYHATVTPRIGLVAQARSSTTLKVLYGSAFLAPSPYQAYGHFGSFTSTDGGQTYESSYWHVANPDLKPQHKKTIEVNLLQTVGNNVHFSVSAFNSWFTDTVKSADADEAYTGLYLGWPVEYIDFPVNEGRARTYGGTFTLGFLHAPDAERRVEATVAAALTDGLVWERPQDPSVGALPVGAMVPVQLRFTADVDWHRWSLAPRLAVVGVQRLLETSAADPGKRRTLAGYAVVDVHLRRRSLFKHIDAFVTLENAFDRRYRGINIGAYSNVEELIGSPQNPRRISVGFDLRLQ